MYQLPKLSYSYQELEPYIDTHTLAIHYHKHEQNYLNKLNSLLKDSNYDYRYSLNELIFHIAEFPKDKQSDILFNLGGVLNHNLYWKSMNPKRCLPYGKLKIQIEKKYGTFEQFWESFKKSASALKGSGYTFLVLKNDGEIDIMNVSNQEIPLSFGNIPLFNIDLWEHAYYLNYENEKERYLNNFYEIIDFSNASDIFEKITR